ALPIWSRLFICESDSADALANWALNWNSLLDVDIAPVLDDEETRALGKSRGPASWTPREGGWQALRMAVFSLGAGVACLNSNTLRDYHVSSMKADGVRRAQGGGK